MPSIPADYKADFDAFVAGPSIIRAAIAGLDAASLNRRPPASDWCVRDVVMHLCDTELVRATRIMSILAEDNPPIRAFDEELYKRRLHYLWRDPELALQLFQLTRFSIAEMLQQCSKDQWARTGEHSEDGTISVLDLVRRGVAHVDDHAAQVADFIERLGFQPRPLQVAEVRP